MVRLLKRDNLDLFTNLVYGLFRIQENFTRIIEYENPNINPCIYAMWHAHQFCVYGINNRNKLHVLVSQSKDGDVIAGVIEKMGFKTLRGSTGRKGAVEASMQMITTLKEGNNVAMMIDGPRGPARKVKKGVIKIAQLSGAPIVPVYWHSTNFTWAKFNSWDEMRSPIFATNMVNVYGKPIYVPEDRDEEDAKQELQKSLEDLEAKADDAFYEVFKNGIWLRKK